MRRQAKNAGNFFVEPEAKLAFVVRIRGFVARSEFFFLVISLQYQPG